MADFILARVLHVIAIILWIGGVSMVTTVLLPSIRKNYSLQQRHKVFHDLESRFAGQARWVTVIAGASGFYMAWRSDMWSRFTHASFWWMHAMVGVWLIFTLMLFVIEPFFLEKKLHQLAESNPEQTYRIIEWLHRILLLLSLLTVAGAVAGSLGFNFFNFI